MEKTGRKALFEAAPSKNGNAGEDIILEDWAKIIKSAVDGDASLRIDTGSVDGSLKSLGEALNYCIDGLGGVIEANAVLQNMTVNDFTKKVEGNYEGIFAEIGTAANALVDHNIYVQETVVEISEGNLERLDAYKKIGRRSQNDEYLPAFIDMMQNIQSLVDDAGMLAEAGVEGRLDTRADASKHQGDFRTIIEGVNDTLDAVVGPLNVAAEYVDRISKGDIPEKVTDDMKGDFNEIKNNLNYCIDGLGGLIEANAVLQNMTVNDYTKKVEGDYLGIFAEIGTAANALVDHNIYVQETVVEISEGNLERLDAYKKIGRRSQNDEYLPAFIDMMQNIQSLVDDAGMLAEAGVEGRLDTRADASKHQGDFRTIIEGVNDTLDAVVGPLNVAAEYVDRISKGDIPEKVTDEWKGDFNEIKNNLNQCIDAVNLLVADAGMLAEAGVEGRLDVRADASKHQGDFAKIVEGVNETLDAVISPLNVAVDFINDVAAGNNVELITDEYRGDYARIKGSVNKCHDVLYGLLGEIGALTEAGVAGRLDTRGNADQFDGAWVQVVGGINDTLDAVVGPLNVAAEYVDRISKGDIPEKVTDEWKGDFNEVKNNLNHCIDAINLLVADAGHLAEAGVEGRLDTRADASRHQGDFRKIVEGVNDTLDAVVGPLNVAAEYVDRISKGDIPEKVTDEWKGDFNEVKNNLNQCIDAVNLLVADAGHLAEAGVEGRLDTRADASRHQGDFAKIVEGVNDTLDAVVGPLNVAAEYVDRISKGDIPEKVTDEWKGDFNEVKNNLNQCIDAVNLLVADAGHLAEAGVDGRLDARADASKHQGDFRKIVDGVNGTLDAIGAPLQESMAVLDRMATNDYTIKVENEYPGDYAKLTGNVNLVLDRLYHVQDTVQNIAAGDLSDLGDYKSVGQRSANDKLIPSIIGMIESLQSVVDDANMLAQAGINGQLDVRADAGRHAGAYGEVILGINNTLDAVVGPLNVAAEYVDRIGKGEVPEKITDAYAGDFNEIKNNLNQCIDGLGGLVEANDVLQKMAVNDHTTKVEGSYQGIFADVGHATNKVLGELQAVVLFMKQTANGDLGFVEQLKARGSMSQNDEMTPAAIAMQENLLALVKDAEMLAEAGVNGQLDVRADVTRHAGAYGEVIGGINNCLDAVVGPLNVAAEYVDRIGKGEMPERITDAYAGDFNELKNNLNMCIDGLGGLVEANDVLQKMAVNDHTTKVEGSYQGIFADVGHATNKVLGELQAVVTFMKQTADGDLGFMEILRERGQLSQNDEMTAAAIAMQANLFAVVNDANMLAQAGINGQLDVRADATRHEGAYRDVIGGINNCLDAVVGPLNVAAEYVDRIGKGDIPERITDAYAGDFNELKNNLNQCIDAVGLLVQDTNMLVEAAAVGKLTARADISQHAGDYAKIVGGINQTLDIINSPFREVNAAIEQLDATTDETTRGADEIAKAAEQVAVTSQLCADLSNSLINQIEAVDRQIADLSASNEEIASTSQEVHEHAVQTAEIGGKAQKLGAEANAKMNIVEGIAKQSVDEMSNLNSRMKEIDNVVKQVNDITNQINLLALNAAIEAARAGEHGRGFAVVAGEVRNLAEEAKQATGQIDQVIAGVQAISAKTAEAIGSAHAEIGSGVASVNETIEALNEIVQGSQDMKVNIDEIARAIEEQATMANRIVEAMEESGRLTRETQGQVEELASLAEEASASTEEIGSSIHEVKGMAGELKQTMDKFEV